jgi:hypothetical protein
MPSELTIIKECEEIAEALSEQEDLSEAKKKYTPVLKVDKAAEAYKSIGTKFKEHLKAIGKKATIPLSKIAELNNRGQMPTMLKHCVVAVQPKLRGEGSVESFIGAHNICYWSFEHHGLANSKTGLPTSRGLIREKHHRSAKDPIRNGLTGSGKTAKYNEMFNKIFKRATK